MLIEGRKAAMKSDLQVGGIAHAGEAAKLRCMVGDATFERMRPARPASRYSCDDNILALRHANDPQRGGAVRAASRVRSQPADQWQRRAASTLNAEGLQPLALDSTSNPGTSILAKTAASAARGSAQGDRTGGGKHQR